MTENKLIDLDEIFEKIFQKYDQDIFYWEKFDDSYIGAETPNSIEFRNLSALLDARYPTEILAGTGTPHTNCADPYLADSRSYLELQRNLTNLRDTKSQSNRKNEKRPSFVPSTQYLSILKNIVVLAINTKYTNARSNNIYADDEYNPYLSVSCKRYLQANGTTEKVNAIAFSEGIEQKFEAAFDTLKNILPPV